MYRSFQEYVGIREERACESCLNAATWAVQNHEQEDAFEVVFEAFSESVALVNPDTTERQLLQEFLSKLLGKAKSALGFGGQPAPAAPQQPQRPQLSQDQVMKFKQAAQTVSQAVQNAMMAVNQKIAANKDKYGYAIMHSVQKSITNYLQKVQTDPQSIVSKAGNDFSQGMNQAFSGANPQPTNDRFASLSDPMKQRYAQTIAQKIGATGQEALVLNLMNAGFTKPEQIKQQLMNAGKLKNPLGDNAAGATQDLDPAYKARLAGMAGVRPQARPVGSNPPAVAV